MVCVAFVLFEEFFPIAVVQSTDRITGTYYNYTSDRGELIVFDSRIIRRMMCESMLSTNAEVAPMHCCLGEPDCLACIMLLFQTDWITQHTGTAVVSVSIPALLNACSNFDVQP